jgi:hypothetical protein
MSVSATIALAMQSRLAPSSKIREVQARGRVSDGADGVEEAGWGQVWGGWWCCAPPFEPKTDGSGTVKEACEYLSIDIGDEPAFIGSRDVRFAKILGDLKGGEVGICNAFGSRLVLTKKAFSILAGGAFANWDIDKKKVGFSGFPAGPGDGAAVISLSTSGVGLISASGKASLTVDGDSITISGASCALDAGQLNLGGATATNPAVGSLALVQLVTELTVMITTLLTWGAAHTHTTIAPGVPTSPSIVPLVLLPPTPPVPGTRVFIPLA